MATKKVAAKAAPAEVTPIPRSRGPRGTAETARITVLAPENPKREGSKAQAVFAHYENGMTIAEFAASLDEAGIGKEATPNLVYDAKHGFIAIEGYEVPGGVVTKEEKAPKPAKEPKPAKAPKAKKEKAPVEESPEAEVEVMD